MAEGNPIEQDNRNPLYNTLVVRQVLKFLNFEEVKKCRLVSTSWNSCAESTFNKRRCAAILDREDRSPLRFVAQHGDGLGSHDSFRFRGEKQRCVFIAHLDVFFRNQSHNIRELEFRGLFVVNEHCQMINNVNIASWISQSPMVLPRQPGNNYNTTLNIRGPYLSFLQSQLAVPINLLLHTNEISLSECALEVPTVFQKMRPIKMHLSQLTFRKAGSYSDNLTVNEVVDFGRAKVLEFKCWSLPNLPGWCLMTLHLNQEERALKLDSLKLQSITVSGWKSCNWTVKALHLENVPFKEKTGMRFEELDFSQSSLDLCVLPDTLKALYIRECKAEINSVHCTGAVHLPNLKSVYWHLSWFGDSLADGIPFFANCPKVSSLEISQTMAGHRAYQLSSLPPNLKHLKCHRVPFIIRAPLHLETLVLSEYTFKSVKVIFNEQLTVDTLVIKTQDERASAIIGFLKFLVTKVKRLVVGKFNWEPFEYENDEISESLDARSDYYICQGTKGTKISAFTFDQYMKMPRT